MENEKSGLPPSSSLPSSSSSSDHTIHIDVINDQPSSTWQPTIGDGDPSQPSRREPTQQLRSERFEDYIAAARKKLMNEGRESSHRPSTVGSDEAAEYDMAADEGRRPTGDGKSKTYQPSTSRPKPAFEDEEASDASSDEEEGIGYRPNSWRSKPAAYGGDEGIGYQPYNSRQSKPAYGDERMGYRPNPYGGDEKGIGYQPYNLLQSKPAYGDERMGYRPNPYGGDETGIGYQPYNSLQSKPAYGDERMGYRPNPYGGDETGIGYQPYNSLQSKPAYGDEQMGYRPNPWQSKAAYGGDEKGIGYQPHKSWQSKAAYGDGEISGDIFAPRRRNKKEKEQVIRSYDRPSTTRVGVGSSQFDNKIEEFINLAKLKYRNEELTGTRVDPEIINRYSNLDLSRPAAAAKVERVIDPDGESSSLCSGCKLPIFSTPSISVSHGGDQLLMHEQCATLPPQWLHELHPHHALLLHNQMHMQEYSSSTASPPPTTTTTCHNCKEICGDLFYQCPNRKCDFRLDLLCVVQIKIVHRSHRHTLMAIRQRESDCLTCSACDTKHDILVPLSESQKMTPSYLCNLCAFWIHPDCASLPNAILHYKDHQHSLFLTYNLPNPTNSKCFLCSQLPKPSSGVYFCLKCPNYLVHIKCTRKSTSTFKPVFIRDAKVSDLARLPLPNENTSLIPYLRQDVSDGDVKCEETLHPHPLTLNKTDDEAHGRVCNACVQTVAPPFYSCSTCPDFILHSCCAKLPTTIKHPIHEHILSFSPKATKSDISAGFTCRSCHLRCNGFAYSCKACDDFSLDVACAMINPAITHESHKSTHILFITPDIKPGKDEICNCCRLDLKGISYECSICRNFKLHARCALLPKTVRHVFDEHPLELTTANDDNDDDDDEYLCEVCEEHIERVVWYYSCSECNQLFHVDCIPSVDRLSKIKLGLTVSTDCHGCPLALARESEAVWGGRRCRICRELLEPCGDGLAYECSKCFYGTHQNCAEKHLLKSVECLKRIRNLDEVQSGADVESFKERFAQLKAKLDMM